MLANFRAHYINIQNTEVEDTIKTMFDNGYTPAVAYSEFVRKNMEEHSDQLDLLMVMSDRSKVPCRPDFNK